MIRLSVEPYRRSGRGATASEARLGTLKKELHSRLISGMNLAALESLNDADLRHEIRKAAEEMCRTTPDLMSAIDRERLVGEVLDETFGLGPLESLLRDTTIDDILVNGPHQVLVERKGVLEPVSVTFRDAAHLMQIVQRILGQVGRRVDEGQPMADARLADGSRINVVIAPLALDGPLVSIRRFGTHALRMSELLQLGALSPQMDRFLSACVRSRLNVLISGGTGSGKTSLLNALSATIPHQERVVTIEDAAELRLQQPYVARLETRPKSTEGKGEVTTRDLVRNSLRMRPDRIIVGECRGAEVLDMLQAMNTGHDGSMSTLHANTPRDAVSRLEMMAAMAGLELPLDVIRRQIASALNLIVHVARVPGGKRKVTCISEIVGLRKNKIGLRDLFQFRQTGLGDDGKAVGDFRATGRKPRCLGRLAAAGNAVDEGMFDMGPSASPETE